MSRSPEPSVEAGPGSRSVQADDRTQQLYLVHASALRQFLSRWTDGDRQATEDLVRETVRRASEMLEPAGTDPIASSSWLLTLARRVAMDYVRSRPGRAAQPGPRYRNARNLAGSASDVQVTLALKQLSAEHSTVIAELFYRGRSVAETAALLSVDEATVSSRAYHALRAFRCAIATER
ncbi:sigma factor [Dactylosporangium sp. NPDC050688]|uniref:sigma factor-like helix-turn-helix DNA-binding protein n=1 Tax=Dactylosporangium sp. NPDC050688 TaxID=3157217 RepID=UPI0033F78C64